MRKLLLALVLTAPLLGGCQFFGKLGNIVELGTATITNPVTPQRLYETENLFRVAFAGLNAWKQSCVQGVIPATCKAQIAQVQVYTRQVPPYLAQLRAFVKNNDQVNATVIFNQLMDIYNTAKSQAAAAGVNIGS